MLFNSLQFLCFFPVVIGLYYSLPHKFRWGLLLVASYYFYMSWRPEYIILIIISTCIDYYASIKMGQLENKKDRSKYLYLSVLSNLGLLFTFKYYNFFSSMVNPLFSSIGEGMVLPRFNLLLPMGISFYTFQTLSYSIDVYNGKIEPEHNFGKFALFVSFFPQLVAGPIERSERLLPQFSKVIHFDYNRSVSGLRRMGWGFFKKLVIADRLAILVNTVYSNPTQYNGITLLVATIFFTFQIYCDFSGYSDIAIGTARVLGFDLMENFKRPYFSKSISEFWRRWHISLSSWFRDYVYIPLGGKRVALPRYYFNLVVTFLISGLWHGANWTFVAWGALHGLYLVLEVVLQEMNKRIINQFRINTASTKFKILCVGKTFTLTVLAWIFFRANTMTDAIYIIKNIILDLPQILNPKYVFSSISGLGLNKFEFTVAVFSILIMECVHMMQRRDNLTIRFDSSPAVVRWSVYYAAMMYLIFFAMTSSQEFIYFQF